jgi:hypothetical protein
MLVHAQTLLDVTLRERTRRHMRAVSAIGEPRNGLLGKGGC